MTTNQTFPPYPEMIKKLFNTNVHPQYAGLFHALSALLGEAVELKKFTTPKNFREECGDIEFYLEAAAQHFEMDVQGAAFLGASVQGRDIASEAASAFEFVLDNCNEAFDIGKKAWVYGKPVSAAPLTRHLALVSLNLDVLYKAFGVTREQILFDNQEKLIGPKGRFRSGFYSDAAAQTRADKIVEAATPKASDLPVQADPGPAPRSFIGGSNED